WRGGGSERRSDHGQILHGCPRRTARPSDGARPGAGPGNVRRALGPADMGVGAGGLDPEAYRELFLHCDDGVLFTHPDGGQILAANPAACRLLGHSEDALRRSGQEGILAPQDRPRWEAALAERTRTGSFRSELSFLRGDGTTFRAEVTSTVFSDAGGEVHGWIILRDVSERVEADEALRASEQRFRRLVETSTEAFIAMNADGVITEWNRQAEETFGWRREEVLGRRLVDTVIPPHYRVAHT